MMDEIVGLLMRFQKRGIKLWAAEGRLRFSAKKGALTPDLRSILKQRKEEILSYFRNVQYKEAPPITKATSKGKVPLSFAQKSLWIIDRLQPNNPAYNIPIAYRICGRLNEKHFQQALTQIVKRHESLRTIFVEENNEPIQKVRDVAVSMKTSQLENLPAATELAFKESQQPFELSQGPLFRFSMMRLSEDDFVFLAILHHVVCDGWSIAIFMRELIAVYQALEAGTAPKLPESTLTYADYAHWQQQHFDHILAPQLAYWQEKLVGARLVLELPTDLIRPARMNFQGRHSAVMIPAQLTQKLKELTQTDGETLFMPLLAAFATVLYHNSGSDDILIGTPIANRNQEEVEHIIGLFVNTVVLRTQFPQGLTFHKLLEQVRQTCLQAYAHQDFPFEQLVEKLQPERDLSRNPLFQVMFTLQNQPIPDLSDSTLTIESILFDRRTTHVDLTLALEEKDGFVHGFIEYSTELFQPKRIERFTNHFLAILEHITVHLEQKIDSCTMLSEEEREQILDTWNHTDLAYPSTTTLDQLIERQVEAHPRRTAFHWKQQAYTYQECALRVEPLAQLLQARGVLPETVVAVSMTRRPELIFALLAVIKAGGAYVYLDPSYPSARLAFILEDTRATLLLTQKPLLDQLPHTDVETIVVEQDLTCATREPYVHNPIESSNLAYLIYTTGPTGKPKGVAVTHRNAVALMYWAKENFSEAEMSGILFATSNNLDQSIFELFLPLSRGGAFFLVENAKQLQSMEHAAITLLNTDPSMMTELLEARAVPATVKTINLSGEMLPLRLVQRIYKETSANRVLNLYGPSEDTVYSSFALTDPKSSRVTIGRPIANSQTFILNRLAQPVPQGNPGELYLGGDGLARGYHHRPSLTAERFVCNPFSREPGTRLYRTGDLARYHEQGQIEFIGRIDHQVKIRGFRIELGEIEHRLEQHEQVNQAVVLAREDVPGQTRLVAYMVAQDQSQIERASLIAHLQEQLPENMIPASFVELETFPLTPNQKIDRKALPAPENAKESPSIVAPRNATEGLIAAIWSNVLDLERVDVNENFFQIGGHSLLATRVISRLCEAFEVELELATFFQKPTVAALAETVAQANQQEQKRPIKTTQSLAIRGRTDARAVELSFVQERLWFIDKLQPNNPVYNHPFALRVEGPLNEEAFTQALTAIVARHQTLRTLFADRLILEDGTQKRAAVVLNHLEVHLHSISCEDWQAASEQALRESQIPFELSTGPLFRFTLIHIKTSGQKQPEYLFLTTLHHIISDGWSIGIFQQELWENYAANRAGTQPQHPELTIQYADYASWEKNIQHKRAGMHLKYWQKQLQSARFVLELPADHARPKQVSSNGHHISIKFSEEQSSRIKQLAHKNNTTVFMSLLASFGLLLYRYTGQDDLLIGAPIANRNQTEIEHLIGCFVNTLVLRINLAQGIKFHHLLEVVKQTTLAAYAHQDLPFEQLVEVLQPERDLSRNPLFQVMFLLNNQPMPQPQVEELKITPFHFERGLAHVDLSLGLTETDSGIQGQIEYKTDLFEKPRIQRMVAHFQVLVQALLEQPETPLHQLPLLTSEEQEQVLQTCNNTAQTYENQTLTTLLARVAQSHPERDAVSYVDNKGQVTSLTYGNLQEETNQLASYLQNMGIGPEMPVGIFISRSNEMLICLMAVMRAGAYYVPLDPHFPRERLSSMLADAKISILITEDKLLEKLPEHQAHVICLERDRTDIKRYAQNEPEPLAQQDNSAYVLFTSGSTGRPKGVQISHRNLVNFLQGMAQEPGLQKDDVLLAVTTHSFDIAGLELYLPLLCGAKLVIVTTAQTMSGVELLKVIAQEGVTMMQATPVTWRLMLDAGWTPNTKLKVLCGGEALPIELAKRILPQCGQLWNMYGPTETTIWSAIKQLKNAQAPITIGKPIANTQIYIVDRALQPLPEGIPGELLIGGHGLSRGYLKRPALSAPQFIPDPFTQTSGSRLYKTGDLARRLPDGGLECLGRIDHQVKLRGYRIETGDIETHLAKHATVKDAVVVVHQDRPGEMRLVAYLVATDPTVKPDLAQLRAFSRGKLPDYMLPANYVYLPSFPLTANGKVNRRALPKPNEVRIQANGLANEQTAVEEVILSIWKELLQIDSIGLADGFFDLGGHSLLLVRMQQKLEEAFKCELTIMDLFQYTTVSALAEYLSPGHGQTQLQAHTRKSPHELATADIAIVGMAGRFPQAPDVDSYWQKLRDGQNCITYFTEDELITAGVGQGLLRHDNYVKANGYLEGIDLFDAAFFNYSPREARLIDPQHRLFLEGAWHAMEHAGYNPYAYSERVGVFAGTSLSSYLINNLASNPGLMESSGIMQILLANDKDFLPTRVSYKLNLKGPSLNVNTACSSSLVAVHMACMSLQASECEMALAGGVRIAIPARTGYLHEEGGILSPDGYCRAFDKEGRGMLSGSGFGIVVLKRLEDAINDRDTIHALIKSSAINNDGSEKIGFTAPSINGQAEAIAQALEMAKIDPETIGYVEAHGTGTELGDPIEIAALTRAYRTKTEATGYCAIGSAKTNIGHLDAAAGIASLIKTVLSLKHRQIPASLNFKEPNPNIDFPKSPFFVNTKRTEFPRGQTPRRAGISSFGLGGTNAHAILEEAPETEAGDLSRSWHLLPLSAREQDTLQRVTDNLRNHLGSNDKPVIADVAYTLQVGRQSFKQRQFVVASDSDDAIKALADPKRIIKAQGKPETSRLVFMFTGQGTQYVNMARNLYETEDHFQADVNECSRLLLEQTNFDLLPILYPNEEADQAALTWALNQTVNTQPALFVVEYAMARLWMSWGFQAQAFIGHSIGEWVAATLAGVFRLEDALKLVVTRGRLMQEQPPGDMLAVPLGEQELKPHLVGRTLNIAAVNTPTRTVVSGRSEAITTLKEHLSAHGIRSQLLHTSHAFHSQMMEATLEPIVTAFSGIQLNRPHTPIVSNLTGSWLTDQQARDPRYWARHLGETVRFAQSIETLMHEKGARVFMEVGPGKTLVNFVKQQTKQAQNITAIASIPKAKPTEDEVAFLAESIGRLWLSGYEVDWQAYHGKQRRRRLPLPSYPFAHQKYWIEPGNTSAKLGPLQRRPLREWFYVPSWTQTTPLRTMLIPRPSEEKKWLIFQEDGHLSRSLQKRLEASGQQVVMVRAGRSFKDHEQGSYTIDPKRGEDYQTLVRHLINQKRLPDTILHLWNITPVRKTIASRTQFAERCIHLGFFSLMYLVQALEQHQLEQQMQLGVVSNGMQEINEGDLLYPEKATLLGAVKVIPREYPNLVCRAIDIEMPDLNQIERSLDQLIDEMGAGAADTSVAYRGGRRWVQDYQTINLLGGSPNRLRQKGTYLITGGLSGVGLLIATHLARTVKANLILTRRTHFPPKQDWNSYLEVHGLEDSISQTITQIREMESLGATVYVAAADVTNREQMRQVLAETEEYFAPINGVLHAAGLTPSGMFSEMTAEKVQQVLAPKLMGTLVLEDLLGERDLDFFVLFSSTSAILGNMGYGDYVAANAFLDAFAHYRSQDPSRYTVSVNWDGWQEVGMALKGDMAERNRNRGEGALANAISNHEGIEVLNRVLGAVGTAQIVVSTLDLKRMLSEIHQFMRAQAGGELADELEKVHADDLPQARPESQSDFQPPTSQTEKKVAAHWCEALGFDKVSLADDFFELGGDSLLGGMLASKFRKVFKIKFSARMISECTTVASQAHFIETQLAQATKPTRPRFEAPQTETQQVVATLWEKEFKQEQVGLRDHFAELGGNLSHAKTIIEQLAEHMNLPLTTEMVLGQPILEEFAETIDTLQWAAREVATPAGQDDYKEFDI